MQQKPVSKLNFKGSILLILLLVLICLSTEILAQIPSTSVKVTITAVAVKSSIDVGGESPDYRFQIWYNDNNAASCIGLDNKSPDTWYTVNYIVTTNSTLDLESDFISLEDESWEEDSYFDCGSLSSCGQGNCTYNSGCACDDDEHMSKREGIIEGGPYDGLSQFQLKKLQPGNYSNYITINYGSSRWWVKYKVTYTVPTPGNATIYVDNAPYASAYLCDKTITKLSAGSAIDTEFSSSVSYVWEYLVDNEETTVAVPNPAYCGDTYNCGGGGGEVPVEMMKTKLKVNSKSQNLVNSKSQDLIIEPGDPPPCCYEPPYLYQQQNVWRSIGTTSANGDNTGDITFDIRTLYGISTITKNVPVDLRVKTVVNGVSSSYRSFSLFINMSPSGPTIGSITSDPTCPNTKSGKINLTNVIGLGQYNYFIKPGLNNNQPCDPLTDGSCLSGILSGAVDGDNFTVGTVWNGDYTFWLKNPGGTKGSCYTAKNITVGRIDDLSISLPSQTNVSCNSGSDGSITLDKTGGVAPYSFTLTNDGTSTTVGTNATGSFTSLPVGSYTASVTDGCLQNSAPTTKTVLIKQPKLISESAFSTDPATCSSPGNGKLNSIVLKSTGTYDTVVSNTYAFKLFKDGSLYANTETLTPSWLKENLAVSANYQLTVSEKNSLSCNAYSKTFSIAAPNALSITGLEKTPVSCYNGTDGAMAFTGTGGSNLYNFKISKLAGDTLANTTGTFSNIYAGSYHLVIENDLPGCNDKATYPTTIDITQPTQILIGVAPTDITCFGSNNGSITSTVSGGTPSYTYAWEKQSGSFWTSAGSTPNLSNQGPGNFRLRITDNKTCVNVSSTVPIIEPSAIGTQNISVNDIKCFGETGTITVQSTGGTLPYTFNYSTNNGSTFNPLTSGLTALNADNYKIKTIDKNGCSFVDPGTYVITAPPSVLDFTYSKSDYNGYNISCFGGSNGFIKVLGAGGNGATYTGYQFSYDGQAYVTLDTIFNINAGNHSIKVKDNRGCIVPKTISFTETSEKLSVDVAGTQDVLCFGDITGSATLVGSGGVSPYTFVLNASMPQASPQFNGLGVGVFATLITDKNGCTSIGSVEIENLHPKILFTATTTNVNCFGGADGSITMNVSGGSSPFEFTWTGSTNTTNTLTNVSAGQYAVTITDNVGCHRDSSITITQPLAPLSLVLKTTPVCYGETTGEIEAIVSGGTTPYQYSSDNGQTLQTGNIITALGVGTQTIYVVDQNGCTKTSTGTIEQRNDKPEPNFLVSTRTNALDTLIIKEISSPKPDSLTWTFDPAATIIDDNPWSPQLKFTVAGTYYISMTGFFSGCDYTVEKTLALNPFDPDAPTQSDLSYRAIESVNVSPNPGPGEFDLKVALKKNYNLTVIVYDMVGVPHIQNHFQQVKGLEQKIDLTRAAEGIYLIRVITDADARDIRIIVQR